MRISREIGSTYYFGSPWVCIGTFFVRSFPHQFLLFPLFLFAVDLKYFTSAQSLEVLYEGRTRRFTVTSVSPHTILGGDSPGDITHDLKGLSIDSPAELWTAGWDSKVLVLGSDADDMSTAHKVNMALFPR